MCSLATETRPRFLVELYTSARSVHTGQTVLLLPYLDLQVPTLINHLNRRTPAAADNTEIDERIAHLEPKDVESIQPRRKRRPIEREASLPGVNGQSQSSLAEAKRPHQQPMPAAYTPPDRVRSPLPPAAESRKKAPAAVGRQVQELASNSALSNCDALSVAP